MPYHDHWLALVALASGEVAYVDRPLYDYVQHGGAVQGAVTGGQCQCRPQRVGRLARRLLRRVRAALGPGADAAGTRPPHRQQAPGALAVRRRRASPGARWLALRPLRRLAGRDETLSGEVALACGIVWRWLLAAAVAGRGRPGPGLGRKLPRPAAVRAAPAAPLARGRLRADTLYARGLSPDDAAMTASRTPIDDDPAASVDRSRLIEGPVLIEARGVHKTFRIPDQRSTR